MIDFSYTQNKKGICHPNGSEAANFIVFQSCGRIGRNFPFKFEYTGNSNCFRKALFNSKIFLSKFELMKHLRNKLNKRLNT